MNPHRDLALSFLAPLIEALPKCKGCPILSYSRLAVRHNDKKQRNPNQGSEAFCLLSVRKNPLNHVQQSRQSACLHLYLRDGITLPPSSKKKEEICIKKIL